QQNKKKSQAFVWSRFKMFTRWLTFIAFLAGSINPGSRAFGRGSVTFASTCRVKGEPEEELILHCGDGKNEDDVVLLAPSSQDLQHALG
ncbi:hypothetical protein AMECASPLE_037924, partial [Ameca splendens]